MKKTVIEFSNGKEDVKNYFHADSLLQQFLHWAVSYRKNKTTEFDEISSQVWAINTI